MEVDGLDIQLALAFGPVKEEPVEEPSHPHPESAAVSPPGLADAAGVLQDPKKPVRVLTRRVAWLSHRPCLNKFESKWVILVSRSL